MKTAQQYPTVALKLVGMKNITCNLMTRSDHLKYEKTSCITLLRPQLISNPHTMCVLKSAHLCIKIYGNVKRSPGNAKPTYPLLCIANSSECEPT